MPALTEAVGSWHEFYNLLGEASATLVALLFVAASVGSGMFSRDRLAPLRMFLSASVVHFSSTLAVSLAMLAPLPSWTLLGSVILACGLYGLCYSGVAWRGAVREGISAKIDLEDRIWYAILPSLAYLVETGSGMALAMRRAEGLVLLAASVAILLAAGIHNAWDITVWSITRPRD